MALPPHLAGRLASLYAEMEAAYDRVAGATAFSCTGCPDNCCDSYFQHHTYLEWAYAWQGLAAQPPERRQAILARAREIADATPIILARGERPQLMCPANEAGLCTLYAHRLMICRLHGVPSVLTRPDGSRLAFPGCFRFQEQGAAGQVPPLDRTDLYRRLARLEQELTCSHRPPLPRVRLTLAGMLAQGPPPC
ncbi:MAG: hypothetical protein AB1634_12680 [Thermodesulfobacteriota bacterium]